MNNSRGLVSISILVILLLALAGAGAYFYLRSAKEKYSDVSEATMKVTGYVFDKPKKSAHYEGNVPAHGAILANVPINIVIDFNFDLAPPSSISVKRDGIEYGLGETIIDRNKLAMRRAVDPDAPNGLYRVSYQACWPDGSCHDGHFQFVIDRAQLANFIDLRNREEVIISLKDITFMPMALRVSRGTRVRWINDDVVEHYVNTDTHPAHTYYPLQNSKILKIGEEFELIFDKKGLYPYHCSAHADIMVGAISVE
jgi:plastocyanin/methionine-rich copper-binding protein CopC